MGALVKQEGLRLVQSIQTISPVTRGARLAASSSVPPRAVMSVSSAFFFPNNDPHSVGVEDAAPLQVVCHQPRQTLESY